MRIFIIPQPGRLVRDPHTKQPVPAGGRFVELDSLRSRPMSSISTSLRVPLVTAEFTTGRAAQGLALLAYRALLIGQKTSGGSWTANTLQKVTNVEQVILGAGRGSMLHRQAIAKWFANNRSTELWIGVLADNGAGVPATGTFTVTGPATAAGTLHLYLGGNYMPVAVTSGDAQNTIAAAINRSHQRELDLPVTATVPRTSSPSRSATRDVRQRLRHAPELPGRPGDAGRRSGRGRRDGSGTTNPVLTTLITAMGDPGSTSWRIRTRTRRA
jgi:hypothetical protein